MVKIIKWLKGLMPTQRRLIQLYTALLYNAHLKGFIQGNIYTGSSKFLCVPGLNCYSCPGATGTCPLGALQNAVASTKHRAPSYVLGILLLYGLILGRTICGFLCPFGLLQELLHKLPTPKIKKSRITRGFRWLKYAILAVFVFIIPLYYALQDVPLPAFCKYICPAGTVEGAVGLLANPVNADKYSMLGALFTNKFLILLLVTGLCIFMYRAFCRFLCPLGAIYGLFAKFAIIGVKVDAAKCVDCGRCLHGCKMDIRHVGDHECIHCGECIDMCPTSAITFKAGKYTIAGRKSASTRRRRWQGVLAWAAAVVLLVGALIFFNLESPAGEEQSTEFPTVEMTPEPASAGPAVGKEPGMLAPAFTAPLYGSDHIFDLSEHKGKVVVINFWATWCTPCINELPHFDAIAQKSRDDVSVIALHSNLVTEDVDAFLGKFDYQMAFALDQTGDIIKSFGGSTMLPQTVILDRNGVIVYNAVGSLTHEKLEALVNSALLN